MTSLFFFFKQKTAYEMRSSDWSSDVCSSDLAVVVGIVAERLDEIGQFLGRADRAADAVTDAPEARLAGQDLTEGHVLERVEASPPAADRALGHVLAEHPRVQWPDQVAHREVSLPVARPSLASFAPSPLDWARRR